MRRLVSIGCTLALALVAMLVPRDVEAKSGDPPSPAITQMAEGISFELSTAQVTTGTIFTDELGAAEPSAPLASLRSPPTMKLMAENGRLYGRSTANAGATTDDTNSATMLMLKQIGNNATSALEHSVRMNV